MFKRLAITLLAALSIDNLTAKSKQLFGDAPVSINSSKLTAGWGGTGASAEKIFEAVKAAAKKDGFKQKSSDVSEAVLMTSPEGWILRGSVVLGDRPAQNVYYLALSTK